MKWTLRCGVAATLMGMSAAAQAGLLGGLFSKHGGHDTCCEQPCRAVVSRPCEQTYTYQRKISNLQPPCCDADCCDEGACAPCDAGCVPSDCAGGICNKKGCGILSGFFKHLRHGKGGLCNHGGDCCESGCAGDCCGPPLRQGDPCEIAKLIYQAQTACYARDRAKAVDRLGDFDTRCHPEVLCTLIYSLNDADEDVRKQAADEIGDLLRKGRTCCSPETIAALTTALGDCDRGVRRQAEEALDVCGYDVVEGCSCDGCVSGGDCHAVPTPAAVPAAPAEAAPAPAAPAPPAAPATKEAAPAPPEDPEAYFPSRYRKQTSTNSSLKNLFSLNN